MKRAIEATKAEFESSSSRTPEYLAWHRLFKKEVTAFIIGQGGKDVEIGKPNHFDLSGFFTAHDGQQWYIRLGDLRGFKDTLLLRTVKHYKDYTGGHNCFLPLTHGEEEFADAFKHFVFHQ